MLRKSNEQKKCSCLEKKDLRDIIPLYPALKSWIANQWMFWRVTQQDIGIGMEMRISNLRLGGIIDM